jgi:hypothetical protein
MHLRDEFERRGPWVTRFTIDGQPRGGQYDAWNDPRLRWFQERFPDVATVLELGSLEGGHTARLAAQPGVRRVVGVEGRPANIERARFVHGLLGSTNVEFVQADLEHADLSSLGTFDAVACLGVTIGNISGVSAVNGRPVLRPAPTFSRSPPWHSVIIEAGFSDARSAVRGSLPLAFLSLFSSYRFRPPTS